MEDLLKKKDAANAATSWFSSSHPGSPLNTVAYFSMEFMLSEALPIYVGGLGNVAGDQLKSASDLGVPVVAIGLLYQQGYFRQVIDRNGDQRDYYPYNDPGQLPIIPVAGGERRLASAGSPFSGEIVVAADLAGTSGTVEIIIAGQQRCRESPALSGDHC